MTEYSFEHLVSDVKTIHNATSNSAKSAVNQLLTIRNWVIGYYIVEFEQNGRNRAEYGADILNKLAKTLSIKGLERHSLNKCRSFYTRYPQIWSTVSTKFSTDPEQLITQLSFSHLCEIMRIEDPFERFFYEFECMQGVSASLRSAHNYRPLDGSYAPPNPFDRKFRQK